MEERTKPFRGATGAVHPMLTESIVQFQAQAFKELMPAGGPVRTQTMGKETLDKVQQASRVQDFMNYQITTVMKSTPEFDQLLFYTGYGGSAFKKVYYDYPLGRMVSRVVLLTICISPTTVPVLCQSAVVSLTASQWTQMSSKAHCGGRISGY